MSAQQFRLILWLLDSVIIAYALGSMVWTWWDLRRYKKARILISKIEELARLGALDVDEGLDLLYLLIDPTPDAISAVRAELRKVLA